MRISDWIEHQSKFNESINTSDLNQLLCHVLSVNTAWLMGHQDTSLAPTELTRLEELASQLCEGRPLNYLTGTRAFWDVELKVNEHTLVPRPDTETLIEAILDKHLMPDNILDLGTGSGALAIVLARLFTKASVLATDVSAHALEVAAQNRDILQVSNLELQQSNWFEAIPNQLFDLIVSNPPYIAADDPHLNDLIHEPITALVAGKDGLDAYRDICQHAGRYLQKMGWLFFEHGWQQHQQVAGLLQQAGFTEISSTADIQGHLRVTMGRWPG
ncbi:peptide chain release factor N(5)-glutamine methyltransferase [Marinicella sediminis]|uniref:Release factor glutamine methyltransferase n=1 Tax=Marinicella sediminis TaxID=1792834 RepID=A0ABV7J8T5_9GAMM|nr:peptide chain release factor N(5)-glutamine methyltransferase [Marinicella sediminis]